MAVIEAPVNTPEAWSLRAHTIAEPWTACGWSREGQLVRHANVRQVLDPQPGERMLDYGCGTGELSLLVPEGVGYVGYDPALGMVERAGEQHAMPGRAFVATLPPGRFDLVACVGCFNLPDGWSKQRTWHTLRHLWDVTGCRALAVSLYAGDDAHCLRYEYDEIVACGRQLSHDVLVDRILPNDLLMAAWR